jgi:hypothetical protein
VALLFCLKLLARAWLCNATAAVVWLCCAVLYNELIELLLVHGPTLSDHESLLRRLLSGLFLYVHGDQVDVLLGVDDAVVDLLVHLETDEGLTATGGGVRHAAVRT